MGTGPTRHLLTSGLLELIGWSSGGANAPPRVLLHPPPAEMMRMDVKLQSRLSRQVNDGSHLGHNQDRPPGGAQRPGPRLRAADLSFSTFGCSSDSSDSRTLPDHLHFKMI